MTATLRAPGSSRTSRWWRRSRGPYLRPAVVERDGLLQQLLRADAGLVTMIAPPGYGKSTSLALWRAKERRPVGWVTCDAADADPIRFLGYLGLAIERALELDRPVFAGSSLHPGSALSNAVPRLTSTLHDARRPMVLMLDDVTAWRARRRSTSWR